MIDALHLLWIIPVSASFGFVICVLLTMNRIEDTISDNKK